MADQNQDPVEFTIADRLKEISDRIDEFNKRDKGAFKKNDTATAATFFFYDNAHHLNGKLTVPVDNNGMITDDVKKQFLEQAAKELDKQDFNSNGKISLKETLIVGDFTNDAANNLLDSVVKLFRENGVDVGKTAELATLASRAARDGKLSVAEDEAISKFLRDNHIKIEEATEPKAPAKTSAAASSMTL